jgi:hypothetical protein
MTLYLVLYVATLVAHVALVSYVLVGAGWLAAVGLARRPDDAVAAIFRDWLPFSVGAAITAGVAPLLFVQLLYQERFYTANLLLGPRWLAVIPALIVGFYAVYLAKSKRAAGWHPRWRAAAAAVAAGCFVFVAWSWAENHLLSLRDDQWIAMYGAGRRVHLEAQLPPRLLLWLAMAMPTAASIVAWQVRGDDVALRRLRVVALAGTALAAVAGGWLYATLGADDASRVAGPGGAAVAVAAAAHAALWASLPASRLRLALTSALGAAALITGAMLREQLRIERLGEVRPRVEAAGGLWLFLVFLLINTAAIVWCVRSARRHLR